MLFGFLLLVVYGQTQGQLLVNTKYGPVEGHIVTFNDLEGTQIRSFLGVPFAKDPSGPERFQHPKEPEPWTEPFIADRLGNVCFQSLGTIRVTHPLWDRVSEDCLNINIYTPYNSAVPGPYPVMVWFHGGSYRFSANIQYPGHFYAKRNVIMISANYRLGNFGFTGLGDEAFPGNQGIMDQLQVLKWVRENIVNFGGDPNRVTIFGQSAGGASVGLHLVSPLSRGYFQQAILHSGTDMTIWACNPTEIGRNLTLQVAERNNCSRPTSQEIADCLRGVDAETLRRTGTTRYPGYFTLGMTPMVAGPGSFLPDTPLNLRQAGNYSHVPVIAGVTSNEIGPGLLEFEDGFNKTTFREIFDTVVPYVLARYDQQMQEDVSAAAKFEYTDWPYEDDLIRNRDAINAAGNDLAFQQATDTTTRWQSRSNTSYMYNFGYRSEILDLVLPDWTGVFHAADIPYIFCHTLVGDHDEIVDDTEMDVIALIPWTDADKDFCNYWMDMLANFAKTGNPTPQPQPAPPGFQPTVWKPWSLQDTNLLNITRTVISQRNQWRQRTFAMWREYVPWMLSRRPPTDGSLHDATWSAEAEFFQEALPQVLNDVMAGIQIPHAVTE